SDKVMGAAALSPRTRDCQVCSVPTPLGVTSPTPVTTTRSMLCPRVQDPRRSRRHGPPGSGSAANVLFDVVHRVLNGSDLLGILVGNVDLESFLERQDELHEAQRIRAEVVDERRLRLDIGFVHVELLLDDPLHLGRDVATFSHVSSRGPASYNKRDPDA